MRALLNDTLVKLGDHTVTYGSAFYALVVLVVAMVLLRIVKGIMDHRAKANNELASRLHSAFLLLKYAVWVGVIVTCLEILGFSITFIIAGSAALLVGLGLGLQQTFMDVVSGIIILMEGTIRVGDVLEVEGLVGRVTVINLRTSTVYSRDGMNVIVPNHRFINENVVNWSHNSLETRFRLQVGVAYGSDERTVQRILTNCATDHPMTITSDPTHPVVVRLIDFGDSSLDFEILFWSRNIFSIEQTKSEIRFSILDGFRKEGVVIPFPQRDVHMIPPPSAAR
jgi:small-conductance mechanosensitive channel